MEFKTAMLKSSFCDCHYHHHHHYQHHHHKQFSVSIIAVSIITTISIIPSNIINFIIIITITTISIHIRKINFILVISSINIIKAKILVTTIYLLTLLLLLTFIIIINTIIIYIITTIITIITTTIIISVTILVRFTFITTIITSISTINIIIPPLSSISLPWLLSSSTSPSPALLPSSSLYSFFYVLLSVLLMLGFYKIHLMKHNFFMFNSISFYTFIEYSTIYINIFLKMCLGLIKLKRISFPGIFAMVWFLIILPLPKQTIRTRKKLNKENTNIALKLTLHFICYVSLC